MHYTTKEDHFECPVELFITSGARIASVFSCTTAIRIELRTILMTYYTWFNKYVRFPCKDRYKILKMTSKRIIIEILQLLTDTLSSQHQFSILNIYDLVFLIDVWGGFNKFQRWVGIPFALPSTQVLAFQKSWGITLESVRHYLFGSLGKCA